MTSQRLDLYVTRDTWLHRLDPRVKTWAVLLAGIVGLAYKHLLVLAGLLLLTHLALLLARVPGERVRWLWRGLAPVLLLILILQPLFAPGPGPDLLRLGPVRLTQSGILEGVSFALRAAALAFVVALLLATTQPTALVQGLVRVGLPYAWGLTIGLAIRYLPTTYGLFVTVREAQEARGWIVSRGNFVKRARAHVPVLVATIIASLRLSDSLGLALAARGLGYPARRTTLHHLHFGAMDWIVTALVTAVLGGLIVLRFVMGLGGRAW
ncbi:MAG: energy-coupling factor transporter transmembrane protein EcfT [Anaerolineae bacterium]|nr:energy-coupling factor transporter transmembrane protein EcfT [Anaerolineae bacterium]